MKNKVKETEKKKELDSNVSVYILLAVSIGDVEIHKYVFDKKVVGEIVSAAGNSIYKLLEF